MASCSSPPMGGTASSRTPKSGNRRQALGKGVHTVHSVSAQPQVGQSETLVSIQCLGWFTDLLIVTKRGHRQLLIVEE
jgi:hypothetical protein